MTVEKNFSLLPKVAPPDLKTRIMAELIKPYATIRQLWNVLKLPYQENCIVGKEVAADPRYRKALVSNKYKSRDILK